MVNDDDGMAEMPQDLWQSQLMDWLRVTFRDLYHRAQTLEDLVRSASAVTGATGSEAGRSQVDVDGAAWSLAVTVANTPRPPLPHIPLDVTTASTAGTDTEVFPSRLRASS